MVTSTDTITATVDSEYTAGYYLKKTTGTCAASDFTGSEIPYTFNTPIYLTTADNTKFLCFKSVDAAGNTDYEVSPAIVGVTTTASVSLKSDTGTNTADGITNSNTPTLSIIGFRSTDTITVTATKTGESDVTAELTGNGEVTLAALVDGVWSISAVAGTVTATLQITIDTVIPVLTTAPALTGAAADGYINDAEKAGTAALVTAPTATDAAAITTTYAVLGNTGVCDSTTTTAATVPHPGDTHH